MQLIDKLVFECQKTGYRAEIEFHGKVNEMRVIVLPFQESEERFSLSLVWMVER